PSGDWSYVRTSQMTDPVSRLAATGAPVLVNLRWRAREGFESIADLFGWKRSARNGNQMRSWATLEEASLLQRIAEVEVMEALACDGWSKAGLDGRLLGTLLGEDGEPNLAGALSWSAG